MMTGIRHVAVIDIGKTNAKVALVDLDNVSEIAVCRTANTTLRDSIYPHYDVERLWDFILGSLATLNLGQPIDAISVTTHGATATLLRADGELALPVLDYEHDGPEHLAVEYDALRPGFSESGTPRLPLGLNLGAQIHWQSQAFPLQFADVRWIVTYPQYWACRLSGVPANEVTSLGCHTDLWNLSAADFSSLVDKLGWRALMAPIRKAHDRLGSVLPLVAQRTGIAANTPVFCGIHDSNASLLPHLLSRSRPFAVVSTGTWVVAMAVGGKHMELDPGRDTLINVNAFGEAVPSARFMGGRDYAILTSDLPGDSTDDDVAAVLEKGIRLLPSVTTGSGPFPRKQAKWISPDGSTPGQRRVAASFYLAMMTSYCLGLAGASGDTVVEGPFARNELYVRMLAAATRRPVIAFTHGATGTSTGAALLAATPGLSLPQHGDIVGSPGAVWEKYGKEWEDLQRGSGD